MISDEFVVDDRLRVLIPQHRHGRASGIFGVRPGIKLMHEAAVVERVRDHARAGGKGPALVSAISQCVTETGMISSSPFSARMMRVRCAQGQASDT